MHLEPNAWVFTRHKVVWVAIAKNACTSLKWMFADLVGEDPEEIYRSSRAEVSRRMCIHDRGLWQHVRKPAELSDDERSSIRAENGWFIFSVVRDPRVRIWSAWQSKFLQRDPIYMRLFKDAEWLPRVPQSPGDVIEDFSLFAQWLATHPHARIHKDPHFAQQVTQLDRQTVPFSRIYDITELGAMASDLQAHLDSVGAPGLVSLGRDNDTGLAVDGDVFAGGVREQLESICQGDLSRFGAQWDFEKTLTKDVVWTDDALQGIAVRAAMGERIRDLADSSWKQKRSLRQRDDELRGLRAQINELEAKLDSQSVELSQKRRRVERLDQTSPEEWPIRAGQWRSILRLGTNRARTMARNIGRR